MTNPDTNTLNGALEQLGITMADNLVTMGVSDADPSDGLTTLASKILEIAPVPPVFDGITLTSDKSILSYADSEYATLSAQLTNSGSPASVSGETVTFEVRKDSDDSLVETLTGSTNSSGLATVSYYGEGVGDLSIHASARTFVSETYAIEDCLFYDSLTTDKSRYTTVSGTPVLTYSSDGLNVNSSVATVGLVRNNVLTLPNNYEAELTIIYAPASSVCGGIGFEDWVIDAGGTTYASTWTLSNNTRISANITKFKTGDTVKIVKNGTSISYYVNGSLIVTNTISETHYQHFKTYQNRSTTYKDLKVKPL